MERAPFRQRSVPQGVELSGLFSGRLAFVTNKRDFDFNSSLYELTSKGEHVELSYLTARASYLRDRARRQLLTPGRRQRSISGAVA